MSVGFQGNLGKHKNPLLRPEVPQIPGEVTLSDLRLSAQFYISNGAFSELKHRHSDENNKSFILYL